MSLSLTRFSKIIPLYNFECWPVEKNRYRIIRSFQKTHKKQGSDSVLLRKHLVTEVSPIQNSRFAQTSALLFEVLDRTPFPLISLSIDYHLN